MDFLLLRQNATTTNTFLKSKKHWRLYVKMWLFQTLSSEVVDWALYPLQYVLIDFIVLGCACIGWFELARILKWRCDHRSCDCDLSNRKLSQLAAPNVWVFIAQLVEHCTANAEATGLNPVEAPKTFFWLNLQLLKLESQLRWSHLHFICMSAVHIILISKNSVTFYRNYN